MENITNGEKERKTEKPATAESSVTSQTNEKRSTKKTKQPITPAEAAELLTSALKYCQESGLTVAGYNEGGELILFIKGLEYNGAVIQPVTLINVTYDVEQK